MIKETNERIMITLPKKQVAWLRDFCAKKHITTSTFIKYLLVKKTSELAELINIMEHQEDINEIVRIITTTKWLDE